MHRVRLLGIAFVAAAWLAGTAATSSAQSPGALLGRVFVEGARTPVAGATITLERFNSERTMTLVADDRGRFTHVGIRPGFYTVVVECDGYAPVELRGVEVRSGDRVRLSIEATPANEAPFTRRIIRYRRPLVNVEDATISTRVM